MIPEPNRSVSCPCCQVEIQYHNSHEYLIKHDRYFDCPYCGEPICVVSNFLTFVFGFILAVGFLTSAYFLAQAL